MTEELKPCPFCGGEASLIYWNNITPAQVQHYQVAAACHKNRCKCAPRTAYETSEKSATKAWNQRHEGEKE